MAFIRIALHIALALRHMHLMHTLHGGCAEVNDKYVVCCYFVIKFFRRW